MSSYPNLKVFTKLVRREIDKPHLYEKRIPHTTVTLTKYAILYNMGIDLSYNQVIKLLKEEFGYVYSYEQDEEVDEYPISEDEFFGIYADCWDDDADSDEERESSV